MIKKLAVTKDNGLEEEVFLKKLDISYIDKIMELQQHIVTYLDDKELYGTSDKEEFINVIKENGVIIGCVNNSNDLIAMGVYARYGYNDHNYGYDLEIKGEELLKVGQIESTVVNISYRGNKLQKIICNELEEFAKEDKMEIISATVSPKNPFSLNTFITMGYEIYTEKLKYGGLMRYILWKKI